MVAGMVVGVVVGIVVGMVMGMVMGMVVCMRTDDMGWAWACAGTRRCAATSACSPCVVSCG